MGAGKRAERATETRIAIPRGHGRALIVRLVNNKGVSLRAVPLRGELVIGRSAESDITVDDTKLSRRHAALRAENGRYFLEDLGSLNGTYHAGRRLHEREAVEIVEGDMVTLGSTVLMFESEPRGASPKGLPSGVQKRDTVPERAPRPRPPSAVAPPAVRQGFFESIAPVLGRVGKGAMHVLILGESGVGKEVLARVIHQESKRKAKPLVSLACGAFSEQLLEAELFGYGDEGTGKVGLLEAAHEGTVFLDEVSELPLPLQGKVLRVIEQGSLQKGGKKRKIDVRFVAASDRNLTDLVARGAFRPDLLYRLNGVSITIPPLRDRVSEIEPLCLSFVADAARQAGRKPPTLSSEALVLLKEYSWPGNVRELRNVMQLATLLAPAGVIEPQHLPSQLFSRPRGKRNRSDVPSDLFSWIEPETGGDTVQLTEKDRILKALSVCRGNQTQAAKLLGMSRRALVSRLDGYSGEGKGVEEA